LVGEKWSWTDKLKLSDEEWRRYVESENLRTWVAYSRGEIAGYYELQRQEKGNVEIAYFGLTPKFIGKGYGGYLLTHAILSAWSWGETRRVWVHTCTSDHVAALQNYKARGLKIYGIERS
jgi:GNAT superfamily N-acetyltransferase